MKRPLCRLVALCVSGLLAACGGGSGSNCGGGCSILATHFSVTTPQDATVGASFSFTVTALDSSNAVATSYAGMAHFASTDSQAVLPANSKLANGTGTFSATFNTSGSQTITATDTVTPTITGVSNAIQRTAPLTALHATGRSVVDVGEKNMEGRHVGLDFYDLLIEVKCGFGRSRWRGGRLRVLGRQQLWRD